MSDQYSEPSATPSPALRHLDAFVGAWQTVGDIRATADTPAARMQATDRYEWLPGDAFLAHHWNAQMPDGRTQGLEIIGYDVVSERFPMHAFDSHGTITIMHATVDGDTWTFKGDALRFTGGFRDDGDTFAGLWEMKSAESDAWVPWMELTLTRDARS